MTGKTRILRNKTRQIIGTLETMFGIPRRRQPRARPLDKLIATIKCNAGRLATGE